MEFMKKVEKTAKKIGETATDTYNVVVDKSGKMIEDTKSKIAISEKENQIEDIYMEIGKIVYDMYQQGEDVGERFKTEVEKIDTLKKEIAEINIKILANKGLKTCNECGKIISVDNHFCPNCGKEQIQVEIVEEKVEEKQKVCPNCQMICQEDAKFCTGCGAELE